MPSNTKNATETDKFWDSGNNAYLTSSGTDKLCTQATYSGMVGNYCAQLAAKYAVIASLRATSTPEIS